LFKRRRFPIAIIVLCVRWYCNGTLKRVIRPIRGFQRMRTAFVTLTGFETMRMIRRGHCIQRERRATGEIRLVNQLFGLAA
jgi:transposase-like protein